MTHPFLKYKCFSLFPYVKEYSPAAAETGKKSSKSTNICKEITQFKLGTWNIENQNIEGSEHRKYF